MRVTSATLMAPQCLRRAFPALLLLTTFPASSLPARGDALLAVAANFAEPIERLQAAFEPSSGHRLIVATGSTGKLYAQIKNGAPFDVLLAADQARPHLLAAEGLALPSTRFTYAIGRLTLWSPDPKRIGKDGVLALKAKNFRYLAIANPDLAPYGAASKQALQALRLWDTLQDRIVMAQNIGQTHALVATGNAELGLVALSHVLSLRNPAPGSRWDVPPDLHAPIRQDAVLLKRGASNPAARAFLEFLRHTAARKIIEEFGYGTE